VTLPRRQKTKTILWTKGRFTIIIKKELAAEKLICGMPSFNKELAADCAPTHFQIIDLAISIEIKCF
jgi:hypothetical protein